MTKGDRAELLAKDMVERVEADLAKAQRQVLPEENRLAGIVRVLLPHSGVLRTAAYGTALQLAKRQGFDRPLYAGAVRGLAEVDCKRAASVLLKALESSEEAGGFATLSAACFVKDPTLTTPLARFAASRHPHLAFGAEVARASRGESDAAPLMAIAPKIKESYRIALCVELFVPLSRGCTLPPSIGPALGVLRDAERHLGRWLVLGEVATLAHDPAPLLEAKTKAKTGPGSARAAWNLVAWALSGDPTPPSTRPTVELVARLSDRPSADRDTTFLFRLAAAKAPSARPMLEGLAKTVPPSDELAVRAALYLLRDHGRSELEKELESAAQSAGREDIRGLAVAALWDAGVKEKALALAETALSSPSLSTACWANLVRCASSLKWDRPLVDEPTFRRIQWGWLE